MAWTLKKEVVAEAFARLRAERRHEHFVGYLCMCWEAARCDSLIVPKPDFRGFHEAFLKIEDSPLGFPYLKPFVRERARANNLWLNANVAGSYARSSLRDGRAFRKVVNVAPEGYELVRDHAAQALKELLEDHRPFAADLAFFLYRDYAWAKPSARDIISAFAFEFGFSTTALGSASDDFALLFDCALPEGDNEASFEQIGDVEFGTEKLKQSPSRSRNKVRNLRAEDVVPREHVGEFAHPAISRITVDGLLSFAESTEFVLGRLNILVGPNGSGKSNFIDCLRVLKTTPESVNEVFSDASFSEWLNKAAKKKTATIEAVVRLSGVENELSHQLKFGPAAPHGLAPIEERLALRALSENEEDEQFFSAAPQAGAVLMEMGAAGRRKQQRKAGEDYDHFNSVLRQVRDIDRHPEITRLARLYSAVRIYSEWTFGRESKMREMTASGRTDLTVHERMDNLALALAALEDRPAHIPIRNALQELKDTYEDYATDKVGARIGLSLKEHMGQKAVAALELIPSKRLSDGTLRFLALAAILLTDKPAPVICLEEPELGMHPDMIRQVAKMIISASERSQLIVTTHSELLLTALQDDFDALFSFNVSASGGFIRRYDAEQFRSWRADHSLGELWSIGELGGNRW